MKKSRKIAVSLLILAFLAPLAISTITNAEIEEKVIFVGGIKYWTTVNSYDYAGKGLVARDEATYFYQSIERLLEFNETSQSLTEPIYRLATSFAYGDNDTSVTLTLREGVTFHDGTKFNASSVAWNFWRTQYVSTYVDVTNDVRYRFDPSAYTSFFNSAQYPNWNVSWAIGYWDDGLCPYYNSCEIIDEYTVKFKTNWAFAVWSANPMFAYSGQFSPAWYAEYGYVPEDDNERTVPEYDWVALKNETLAPQTLVGTGPYIFVYHNPAINEGKFIKNEEWWGINATGWPDPYIDEIKIQYYDDFVTMENDLLSGSIDWCLYPTDLDAIDNSSAVRLIEGDPGGNIISTDFITPNVNWTVRKALSFAANYDLALSTILNGRGLTAQSCLPRKHPYFTDVTYDGHTIERAYYNLTIARQTMLDDPGIAASAAAQGLTIDSPTEDWVAVANGPSPLAYVNNSHSNTWNQYVDILTQSAESIGIYMEDILMESADIYNIVVGLTTGGVPDFNVRRYAQLFNSNKGSGSTGTELDYWPLPVYYGPGTAGLSWTGEQYPGDPGRAWYNWHAWANEEFDNLSTYFYLANQATGELERCFHDMQRLVDEAYLSIFWFQKYEYAGLSNDWEGDIGIWLRSFQNLVPVTTEPPPPGQIIPGYPLGAFVFTLVSIAAICAARINKKIRK